jgi:hypothetical protein
MVPIAARKHTGQQIDGKTGIRRQQSEEREGHNPIEDQLHERDGPAFLLLRRTHGRRAAG